MTIGRTCEACSSTREHVAQSQVVGVTVSILVLDCRFFKPELQDRGYESVYVKRPSIHVSNWSGEKKHDGCGIFYK